LEVGRFPRGGIKTRRDGALLLSEEDLLTVPEGEEKADLPYFLRSRGEGREALEKGAKVHLGNKGSFPRKYIKYAGTESPGENKTAIETLKE